MNRHHRRGALFCTLAFLVVIACSFGSPVDYSQPGMPETIAAKTWSAMQTMALLSGTPTNTPVTPTDTPTSSATPTITLTPTATITPIPPLTQPPTHTPAPTATATRIASVTPIPGGGGGVEVEAAEEVGADRGHNARVGMLS